MRIFYGCEHDRWEGDAIWKLMDHPRMKRPRLCWDCRFEAILLLGACPPSAGKRRTD